MEDAVFLILEWTVTFKMYCFYFCSQTQGSAPTAATFHHLYGKQCCIFYYYYNARWPKYCTHSRYIWLWEIRKVILFLKIWFFCLCADFSSDLISSRTTVVFFWWYRTWKVNHACLFFSLKPKGKLLGSHTIRHLRLGLSSGLTLHIPECSAARWKVIFISKRFSSPSLLLCYQYHAFCILPLKYTWLTICSPKYSENVPSVRVDDNTLKRSGYTKKRSNSNT